MRCIPLSPSPSLSPSQSIGSDASLIHSFTPPSIHLSISLSIHYHSITLSLLLLLLLLLSPHPSVFLPPIHPSVFSPLSAAASLDNSLEVSPARLSAYNVQPPSATAAVETEPSRAEQRHTHPPRGHGRRMWRPG